MSRKKGRGSASATRRFVEALEERTLLSATLLKDIQTATASSSPSNFAALGSSLLFYADDGINGRELWRLDSGGATRLTNLPANVTLGALTKINQYIYFAVDTTKIWRTDGTTANTVPITNLLTPPIFTMDPTEAGGKIYFATTDAVTGARLWSANGVDAGTEQVFKHMPAELTSPTSMINVNGTLFFEVTITSGPGGGGSQLWKTDGTDAGTVKVKDFPASAGSASQPIAMNGVVYFLIDKSLWRSDGTSEGTYALKTVSTVLAWTQGRWAVTIGNSLFFYSSFGDSELWQSDGTAAGTTRVKDIRPGSSGSSPSGLTIFNGLVYFAANDGVNGTQLWRSDGTDAGTVMVTTPGAIAVNPAAITVAGGSMYFAGTGANGAELWRSDGTPQGTGQVMDIYPGSLPSNPARFVEAGGTVYFAATDNFHGNELWQTGGTAATTQLVTDLNTVANLGSSPAHLFQFNGSTIFAAQSAATGTELWTTDGTPQGTVLLKDIYPGPDNSQPDQFVMFGGQLFFSATTAGGRGLWKTDGTEAGTVLVSDHAIDSGSGFTAIVGNTLYYVSTSSVYGAEIWKTDGTPLGTVLVSDITPGSSSGSPRNLIAYNGKVYFTYSTTTYGRELWSTDGTAAGTAMLKDIRTGSGNAIISSDVTQSPIVYNGWLYFGADTDQYGPEIWKTNGTAAGTVMVYDSNPSSPGYGILPHDFHVFGDYLYFGGDDDVHGDELWRTDGTSAGTRMVADLTPGYNRPNVYHLFDFQGAFYFVYRVATSGYQLFRSDGTAAGTRMVSDPAQSVDGLFSSPIVIYGDLIWYFTGTNSTSPSALWASDGTTGGTRLVTQLATFPSELVPLGNSFIFANKDPAAGVELFKLPLPTARAGGPYQVLAGKSIPLDGSQSSGTIPGDTLTFEWDLDGDGIFGETGSAAARGDETAARPTLSTIDLPPGTWRVWLRVTDADGAPAVQSVDVSVSIPHFFSLSPDALITWEGVAGIQWITLSRGSLTLSGAVHDVYPEAALWVENNASVQVAVSQDLFVAMHGNSIGSLGDGVVLRSGIASFDTSRFDIGSGRIEDLSTQSDLLYIYQSNIRYGQIVSSLVQGDPRLGIATYWAAPGKAVIEARLSGDLNADGQVTISDFIDLASNFNSTNATWAKGDTNYDGVVSIADFITLASNFGQTYSRITPQPQPAAATTVARLQPEKIRRHRRGHLHHRHADSAEHLWSAPARRWKLVEQTQSGG